MPPKTFDTRDRRSPQPTPRSRGASPVRISKPSSRAVSPSRTPKFPPPSLPRDRPPRPVRSTTSPLSSPRRRPRDPKSKAAPHPLRQNRPPELRAPRSSFGEASDVAYSTPAFCHAPTPFASFLLPPEEISEEETMPDYSHLGPDECESVFDDEEASPMEAHRPPPRRPSELDLGTRQLSFQVRDCAVVINQDGISIQCSGVPILPRCTSNCSLRSLKRPPCNSTPISPTSSSSERDCPICLDRPAFPVQGRCKHPSCFACLALWLRRKPECPACCQPMSPSHVRTLAGDRIDLTPTLAGEASAKQAPSSSERTSSDSNSSDLSSPSYAHSRPNAHSSSNAVRRRQPSSALSSPQPPRRQARPRSNSHQRSDSAERTHPNLAPEPPPPRAPNEQPVPRALPYSSRGHTPHHQDASPVPPLYLGRAMSPPRALAPAPARGTPFPLSPTRRSGSSSLSLSSPPEAQGTTPRAVPPNVKYTPLQRTATAGVRPTAPAPATNQQVQNFSAWLAPPRSALVSRSSSPVSTTRLPPPAAPPRACSPTAPPSRQAYVPTSEGASSGMPQLLTAEVEPTFISVGSSSGAEGGWHEPIAISDESSSSSRSHMSRPLSYPTPPMSHLQLPRQAWASPPSDMRLRSPTRRPLPAGMPVPQQATPQYWPVPRPADGGPPRSPSRSRALSPQREAPHPRPTRGAHPSAWPGGTSGSPVYKPAQSPQRWRTPWQAAPSSPRAHPPHGNPYL